MNKCIKYEKAHSLGEARNIANVDGQSSEIINVADAIKNLSSWKWRNDPKALEGIKECLCRYLYLVIFY